VLGLEIEEISHLLGPDRVYGLGEGHFVTDVPEKAVVTRNHDLRCPVSGFDAEQIELDGQERGIFLCVVDISVDSPDKGCDDFFSVRMVVIHLLPYVHTGFEEASADVFFESFRPEDLCESASGLPSPDFKLEEAVSGHIESLREKEVFLVLRIDVRDPPSVLDDLDRLGKAFDADGFSLVIPRLIRSDQADREDRQNNENIGISYFHRKLLLTLR
jgi:hypothetical protein